MPAEVIPTEPAPWVTEHTMHLFNQTESRPLPDGWMEHQHTGLALALCNCGYNSGWIPRDQLPAPADLLAKHGAPQCMCTEAGQCGNCWEKEQAEGTPRTE